MFVWLSVPKIAQKEHHTFSLRNSGPCFFLHKKSAFIVTVTTTTTSSATTSLLLKNLFCLHFKLLGPARRQIMPHGISTYIQFYLDYIVIKFYYYKSTSCFKSLLWLQSSRLLHLLTSKPKQVLFFFRKTLGPEIQK